MPSHTLSTLRIEPHRFTAADLCAGHVVLDFVNTAAGLNREPRDWLASFPDLLDWAALAGIVDGPLRERIEAQSRSPMDGGESALARAKTLRAALYSLVHHRREGTQPPGEPVDILLGWCRQAAILMEFRADTDGRLRRSLEGLGLDFIAATISVRAAELLESPISGYFGVCDGHNCGWIFLDTSPSRRRRWCDMKTCGNTAKANRHYWRSKFE